MLKIIAQSIPHFQISRPIPNSQTHSAAELSWINFLSEGLFLMPSTVCQTATMYRIKIEPFYTTAPFKPFYILCRLIILVDLNPHVKIILSTCEEFDVNTPFRPIKPDVTVKANTMIIFDLTCSYDADSLGTEKPFSGKSIARFSGESGVYGGFVATAHFGLTFKTEMRPILAGNNALLSCLWMIVLDYLCA